MVLEAATGEEWDSVKRIESRVRFGFRGPGKANPAVVKPAKVPRVTGIVVLPTAMDVFSPVKVNVAVPEPECKVMAFVPDPLHCTTAPQLKTALVLNETLNTSSPFGRN